MALPSFFGNFLEHRIHDLRFDRKNHGVGEIADLAVIRCDFDAEIFGNGLPQRIAHIARHDMIFGHQTGANDSTHDR